MRNDRPLSSRKGTRDAFPLPFPRGDSEGFRRGMRVVMRAQTDSPDRPSFAKASSKRNP